MSTLNKDNIKLDDRGEKGVFLGFVDGVKGYRIYLIKEHKFVISGNVKFYENYFPYDKSDKNVCKDFCQDDDYYIPVKTDKDQDKTKTIKDKVERAHKQPSY